MFEIVENRKKTMACNSQSQGNLTNNQCVRLGRVISGSKMESIALAYMNVEGERIKQLKEARREDREGFVRDLIEDWACQPENKGNQVQVKLSQLNYPSETDILLRTHVPYHAENPVDQLPLTFSKIP